MSRNVPDGHSHGLYFLEVNFMLFTMVKTIFKSEDKWPSYLFLKYDGTTFGTFEKIALNVEDFYVKTTG